MSRKNKLFLKPIRSQTVNKIASTVFFIMTICILIFHSEVQKKIEQSKYDELNCGCPRNGIAPSHEQNVTWCSDFVTSLGEHQNVLSYVLYGKVNNSNNRIRYYDEFLNRLSEVTKIYPGKSINKKFIYPGLYYIIISFLNQVGESDCTITA